MNRPKQYKKYMKTLCELFWVPQEGKRIHWSFDRKYHVVVKSEFEVDRAEYLIQETFSSRSRNEVLVPIFESASCEESPAATNSEAFEERPTSNWPFLSFLDGFWADLNHNESHPILPTFTGQFW
jgi:hypothetical protein